MEARVDDFHSGISKGSRRDLRAPVMAVEAGLGDQ
jgi:hypothetical protein